MNHNANALEWLLADAVLPLARQKVFLNMFVKNKSNAYILWMAWRQIISVRGHGLSFMTTVSILGVTIGVAALVTVLSVMGGFASDLKDKLLRGLPHIEVVAENAIVGFSLKEHSLESFRKRFPNYVGIEPFTRSDVVLKRGKHLASVGLFGIEPSLGGKLWGFTHDMIEGDLAQIGTIDESGSGLPKIALSETLSINLSAQVGDHLLILSPQTGAVDILSGQSPTRTFEVCGIFTTNMSRDSRYAVVALSEGRKFMPDYDPSLDAEEYVTGVAINVSSPEAIDVYPKMGKDFSGLKAVSWQAVNMSLLFALQLEKYTMGSILLLIVLVASFSISGTMMMMVYHKRSQVALLRSLGMRRVEIAKLFIAQGMTIGFLGVTLGMTLGIGLCIICLNFKLALPQDLYYQKSLPVKFLPFEYCVICICAWILTLIAAVYPALTAARQDPGTGLRYL